MRTYLFALATLSLGCGGTAATTAAPVVVPQRPLTTSVATNAPPGPETVECAPVHVVRVSTQAFVWQVPLDDASLAAFAASHAAAIDAAVAESHYRYEQLVPERRASHVLVRLAADADAATARDAHARAAALLARARHGESFAALARAESEDPGSAASGGDLGWAPRGRMVESFDASLFAARRVGVLPRIIETQFGLHIVAITGIHAGGDLPEADIRADIARQLYLTASSRELAREAAEAAVESQRLGRTTLVASLEASLGEHADGAVDEADTEPVGADDDADVFALGPAAISSPVVDDDFVRVFVGQAHITVALSDERAGCSTVPSDVEQLTPEQLQQLIQRYQAQGQAQD